MIQFARILDVKPVHYVGDEKDLSNVGYDMFVPFFNDKFLEFLLKANEKIGLTITKLLTKEDDKFNKYHLLQGKTTTVGIITIYHNKENKSFIELHKNISIPNGIQFLLPNQHYGELCTRSSNFALDTELVIGYIDNSYTFGSCFQVKVLQDKSIKIFEGEKLGQLILREYTKQECLEIPLDNFEDHPQVNYRRKLRDGGFGSTGRF